MSINDFSTDIQQTLIWWAQQSIMEPNPNKPPNSSWRPNLYDRHYQPSAMFPPQNPNLNFNLNEEDDEEQDHEQQQHDEAQREHEQDGLVLDKEAMFEKPLTPSDVGKLNRLVIPKQHAEKYFPLSGASVDKGLLLSFEDESGKYWRFRYSYWNSSQSYVLTKGWSRYVKEKQLDAGDAVLFERHRTDSDRLFIGWRRRGEMISSSSSASNSGVMVQGSGGGASRRGLYTSSSSSSGPNYHLSSSNMQHGNGANVPFQSDCLHATVTAAQNQTAQLGSSRRLRLFGVNLECQLLDEAGPSTSGGSSLSSLQGPVLHQQLYSHQSAYSTPSQMGSTFSSRDVNQMRNRRG